MLSDRKENNLVELKSGNTRGYESTGQPPIMIYFSFSEGEHVENEGGDGGSFDFSKVFQKKLAEHNREGAEAYMSSEGESEGSGAIFAVQFYRKIENSDQPPKK